MPVSMTTANCKYCKQSFKVREAELKRGYGKFCSRKCSHKGRNIKKQPIPADNTECATCNKTFYRQKSKKAYSKSGLYFCGRECKDYAQRIGGLKAIQPSHYNSPDAYRAIALRHYKHVCNRCGYDEHSEILQVHHIDRNRSNNDLQNLEILCPNCHRLEHIFKPRH